MIFSDTLTVTRFSAQTRDAYGRSSALSSASTFTISASVQRPMKDKEVLKLMEGHRTRDWWHIDTVTALQSAEDTTSTPADRISIEGYTYEVIRCAQVRAVIPHYEALVKRVDEGAA